MRCQLAEDTPIKDMLMARIVLLQQGLQLAEETSALLQCGFALHVDMAVGFEREQSVAAGLLLAGLKTIFTNANTHALFHSPLKQNSNDMPSTSHRFFQRSQSIMHYRLFPLFMA
jgi:hypothetical protein